MGLQSRAVNIIVDSIIKPFIGHSYRLDLAILIIEEEWLLSFKDIVDNLNRIFLNIMEDMNMGLRRSYTHEHT